MGRTVGIGIQDFGKIINNNYFYIDKTSFIREWWESGDDVTLIARPRRFGKTLTMSMLEQFFSVEYADRGELFAGLSIWQDAKYRDLQGTYPVISLSFANVKEKNYEMTRKKICRMLVDLYANFAFVRDSGKLTEQDKEFFDSVMTNMDDSIATMAIHQLSGFLNRYYGKKVILLLDEYDTPMHSLLAEPEAIRSSPLGGELPGECELISFIRSILNAAFKTNPCLERAVMTGITRVSKESVFSDLNNLKVVTTTSDEYATAFGFTEEEVFAAMEECGRGGEKEKVKWWYDGFTFGEHRDIYNPWSILNFLDTGKYTTYWANTSSNSLVGKLIREGSSDIKEQFEQLLYGKSILCSIDEQIVYNQLSENEEAVWSLLLAGGYLKVLSFRGYMDSPDYMTQQYDLAITNHEVRIMFGEMVRGWFAQQKSDYNRFIKAFLAGDVEAMNVYMNRVALQTFSYFDTGSGPLGPEPERFYHGFVLGLIVELQDRYVITSNRESGFGRYDVMLEPRKEKDAGSPMEYDAFILEFKVRSPKRESDLEETVRAALVQIEEKRYPEQLIARGIKREHIRCYGFAFDGKTVLIDTE